jgi:hypothetical protein
MMGMPEIDLAHPLVGPDDVGFGLDENAARDQDNDPRGEFEDDVHVVLDEKH